MNASTIVGNETSETSSGETSIKWTDIVTAVFSALAALGVFLAAAQFIRDQRNRSLEERKERTRTLRSAVSAFDANRDELASIFCRITHFSNIILPEKNGPVKSAPRPDIPLPGSFCLNPRTIPCDIVKLRQGLGESDADDAVYSATAHGFLLVVGRQIDHVRDGFVDETALDHALLSRLENGIDFTRNENDVSLLVSFALHYCYIDVLAYCYKRELIKDADFEAVTTYLTDTFSSINKSDIDNRIEKVKQCAQLPIVKSRFCCYASPCETRITDIFCGWYYARSPQGNKKSGGGVATSGDQPTDRDNSRSIEDGNGGQPTDSDGSSSVNDRNAKTSLSHTVLNVTPIVHSRTRRLPRGRAAANDDVSAASSLNRPTRRMLRRHAADNSGDGGVQAPGDISTVGVTLPNHSAEGDGSATSHVQTSDAGGFQSA